MQKGLRCRFLHIGSYDDEGPVLARLHDEIMPDNDVTFIAIRAGQDCATSTNPADRLDGLVALVAATFTAKLRDP